MVTHKDVVGELAAYEFAKIAHAAVGQKRKYTGEPYFVHPLEVARIVRTVPHNSHMIAAAYLHDVLEDTKITFEFLFDEFGADVAALVFWLTDQSKATDGNRKQRKKIDREHIAIAPPEAKTIKLADLISNTKSIVEHDIEFAAVYLEEKKLLLEVLGDGDPTLYSKAKSLLTEGLAKIEQYKKEKA